jgi:RNA polymerase sigma factor (sigma-70 family)
MSLNHDEVEDLFKRTSQDVRDRLLGMGASPTDVDAYVIDGFLAVARKWPDGWFEGDNPVAYAYKAALHSFYKARKDSQREVPTSELPDSLRDTTEDLVERSIRQQDRAAVRRALRRLAPREREAIELRYLRELGVNECAAIMGVSTGTVKRYTSDALRKLRRILEEENGEGEDQ